MPIDVLESTKLATPNTDGSMPVKAVRLRLRAYIRKNDVSQSAVSRGIGRGSSTISQFLSGSYGGDNEAVAEDVLDFLQREEERAERPSIKGQVVVETRAYTRIHHVARMAHRERDIAVVIGDAGVGKTLALEAYAESHNRSTLRLEVGPEYTTKGLCCALHRETGGDGRGTIYSLMQDVYEQLKGTDTLVIIDQAEILPTRALELCRRLHDVCHIGVVLAGMPKLLANLRGTRGELTQLYSRVGFKARVDEATDDDIQALADALLPAAEGDVVQAIASTSRNPRIVVKLLKRAGYVAELNNRHSVDPEVIEAAAKMLVIPDVEARR